jgi:predicted secreted protein
VGELLRREGLFSTDLARIRQQVKEGALQRLSAKPGRQQSQVSAEAYEAIKLELQNKERALADLSVELAILRKKTNGGSWDR